MRDTRFPALVYDKQHDFKIQNSVNRTLVTGLTKFTGFSGLYRSEIGSQFGDSNPNLLASLIADRLSLNRSLAMRVQSFVRDFDICYWRSK